MQLCSILILSIVDINMYNNDPYHLRKYIRFLHEDNYTGINTNFSIINEGFIVGDTLNEKFPISRSKLDCMKLCARDYTCTGITHNSKMELCWAFKKNRVILKASVKDRKYTQTLTKSHISTDNLLEKQNYDMQWNLFWKNREFRRTDRANIYFECHDHFNIISNNMKILDTNNLDMCKSACLDTVGCSGIVFNDNNKCFLKESTNLKEQDGCCNTQMCLMKYKDISNLKIDMVISHFAENLMWLSNELFSQLNLKFYRIFIYHHENKPDNYPSYIENLKNIKIIRIPNRGLEASSYLYHILTHYDAFADWTLFTQADQPTFGYEGLQEGGGHFMAGSKISDYLIPRPSGSYFMYTMGMNIQSLAQSVRLAYVENNDKEPGKENACPIDSAYWSSWWSLGWFKRHLLKKLHFERTYDPLDDHILQFMSDYADPYHRNYHGVSVVFSQGARFSASKDALRKNPLKFYKNLYEKMNTWESPSGPYFMEWLWQIMIINMTDSCNNLPNTFEAKSLQEAKEELLKTNRNTRRKFRSSIF